MVKANVKIPVDNDEIEEEIQDEVPDETPDDVAMMSLLDEIKNLPDSSIRIYRVGKHPRDVTLIDEVSPLDYTPVMLKHPPYSGGQFRIYGTHRGQFVFNRIIKVEPAPFSPPDQQTHNSVDLATVLRIVAEQNEKLVNQFKEALASIPREPKESRADFLREMAAMKDLFASPVPIAPSQDPIKMLKDVMEIQALSGGSGGDSGGSPLMMLGMKMLDKLGELSQHQAQHSQPIAAPIQQNPVARQAQKLPVKVTPQIEEQNEMSPQAGLELLIHGAQSNGDVDWWANQLFDQLDDAAFELLTTDPMWFEKFSSLDPRISLLKPWFTRVRDRLVEITKEESDPSSENEDLTPVKEVEKTIANSSDTKSDAPEPTT